MANIPYRAVMALIEALADGSLYTTDVARADALEVAPDNASLFWKCVVARPKRSQRTDAPSSSYTPARSGKKYTILPGS